jgi:hypothetical protein
VSLVLEIQDAARLDEIADYIHDCFFNVSDVTFDRRAKTLVVPYRRRSDRLRVSGRLGWRRRPFTRWILRFGLVRDYAIHDTEQIDSYNFNVLQYDADRHVISIRTGVPLEFEVQVDDVLVTVESTDAIVD